MGWFDWLDPEEFVGERWHRLIADAPSYPSHPEASVALAEARGSMAVFFRALGGEKSVRLGAGGRQSSRHRLSFRQRLGMAEEKMEQAVFNGEELLLPPQVDLFDSKSLNRHLYFWLAAYFAYVKPPSGHDATDPLQRDILFLRQVHQTVQHVLDDLPGLRNIYTGLCRALLVIRPQRKLKGMEAAVEEVVCHMLGAPMQSLQAKQLWMLVENSEADLQSMPEGGGNYRPFLPVPLWGSVYLREPASHDELETDEPEPAAAAAAEGEQRKLKAKRKRQDQAERKDSFILNPFGKILGMAEMVNVNRAVDDDDEENAMKAAEDFDELTLASHEQKTATRLRLDLDLPPGTVDTRSLTGGLTYAEWDYRTASYLPDHCRVFTEVAPELGEQWHMEDATRRKIARIRRQFEALRPRRQILRGQPQGNEIDMDALVRSQCDLLANGAGTDRVYMDSRNMDRDMAVAFLMDVSLSTDSWIENHRVLDVEKEALTVLSHGLNACGDDYGIFTFTSRKRDYVRIQVVKGFEECFRPTITQRIAAIRPGYYTRIGAAIRHVSAILQQQPHRYRLLLVLTDGKPNDVDHYEGRYGLEDTRMAIKEARRAEISVFGITVDHKAQEYFPFLFGSGAYHIVGHLGKLPAAMPKIFRQLVS